MALVHNAFVKVFAQSFQGENHIVDLNTINKLSIVSKFHLNTIEFSVKFFQVGESLKMNHRDIFPYVVIKI